MFDEVSVVVEVVGPLVAVVVDEEVLPLGWEEAVGPTTTEEPFITALSQLSMTITGLFCASCSKWKSEHLISASLEAARRAITTDTRTFMAVVTKM